MPLAPILTKVPLGLKFNLAPLTPREKPIPEDDALILKGPIFFERKNEIPIV